MGISTHEVASNPNRAMHTLQLILAARLVSGMSVLSYNNKVGDNRGSHHLSNIYYTWLLYCPGGYRWIAHVLTPKLQPNTTIQWASSTIFVKNCGGILWNVNISVRKKTICQARDLRKLTRSCKHLRLLCPPDPWNLPGTVLLGRFQSSRGVLKSTE